MPPRKVYGKSRSNYDPLAVFDSPQRSTKTINETRVKTVAPKGSILAVRDDKKGSGVEVVRKALGDLNLNSVTQVVLPENNKIAKHRTRHRIVVEDSQDEECESDDGLEAIGTKSERRHVDVARLRDDAPRINATTHNIKHETLPPESRTKPAASWVNVYTQHCSELLELSSHEITTYADWCKQLSDHFEITKIAEASFSEVYRLSLLEEYSDLSSSDESVFKIIPLRNPDSALNTKRKKAKTSTPKQNEGLSSPADVANEVRLLLRMNEVPGFTNFRDIRVIQGKPPKPFIKAYKDFNALQEKRRKDLSLFPDPSKKTSYPDDQLWAIIEMQDAGKLYFSGASIDMHETLTDPSYSFVLGTDLEQIVEASTCTSIFLVWDIFWQTVFSLAKGEEAAEFEHRDLHLGNICVRMPSGSNAIPDLKRKLNFTGVETTIIDYTISRALMEDGEVAYHDLAAETAIFEGDSTEEYQYDIYRYIRGAVLFNNPHATMSTDIQYNTPSWQDYHPISNLIWLHFALHKLLDQVFWPSMRKEPPRGQKEKHRQWKRENDLEHVLLRVRELLDVSKICESLIESASDLVGLALREGWLDEEDVLGGDDGSELVEKLDGLEVSVM